MQYFQFINGTTGLQHGSSPESADINIYVHWNETIQQSMNLSPMDIYKMSGVILTCARDAGECDESNGLADPIHFNFRHIAS
jgi:hypothetical protein